MVDYFYKSDLAFIHDEGFGHIAKAAGAFLLEQLQQAGTLQGFVVDLGCGSGLLAQQLVAAGYQVLGVDLSEAMIEIARSRVPQATFHAISYLAVELPLCDVVTAIGEGFSYLFDPGNTDSAIAALFQRIYTALRPGGWFLFDVVTPGRVPGPGPHQKFVESKDWVVMVTAEEDSLKQILTRQITTFRRVNDLYRRNFEIHRQHIFEPFAVTEQLQGIGFEVQTLGSYGALQFVPGQTGFLARKPFH